MIAKSNKHISVKVKNITYSFIKKFCNQYNCSMSAFCNYCILIMINQLDEKQSNDSDFYKRLSEQLKFYDLRRK